MAQNTPQGPIYTLILTLEMNSIKKFSPQAKSFFWTWAPSHWEKMTGTPEDALEGFKLP